MLRPMGFTGYTSERQRNNYLSSGQMFYSPQRNFFYAKEGAMCFFG